MIPADYRSWTFGDRAFIFAVTVSILWHLFWFFAVTIVVTPPKQALQRQPRVVSLGPVLNDAIFRTLVETRPEISKAFYRPSKEFNEVTDVPVENAGRYAAGDVVSIPAEKKIPSVLEDEIRGTKALSDDVKDV